LSCLPEVITHNYDPEGVRFGNLCDLPLHEAEAILQRIRDTGKRSIRDTYLRRRLNTEEWLIRERQQILGQTFRERPIYFFLGDFADGKDSSRPSSIILPLSHLPPDTLTFTYPDSMASLPLATDYELKADRRPYHGQVFTLDQIRSVVREYGLPDDSHKVTDLGRFDHFIEVQVWDERPILEYLGL
jgi:hypothetical protein